MPKRGIALARSHTARGKEGMALKNIYVLTDHMELCKDGECVSFLSAEGQKSKESLGLIESIMLMGNAQITAQAMRACLQKQIPIYHTTLSGRLLGISSPFLDGFLKRRMNQYAVCSDPARSLTIAKAFVHAKTEVYPMSSTKFA